MAYCDWPAILGETRDTCVKGCSQTASHSLRCVCFILVLAFELCVRTNVRFFSVSHRFVNPT
jgi:hypothetical protein